MMPTLAIALFAMALGGLLDKAGYLHSMLYGILNHLKGLVQLLAATMLTGFVSSIATGQSFISIVLTAQLFKKKYEEDGYLFIKNFFSKNSILRDNFLSSFQLNLRLLNYLKH